MKIYRDPSPELLHQLELSRLWYATSGSEGARAYLAFEQHTSLNLSKAVLVEATLQETDFCESCLDDASLIGALANGLCLREARFHRCGFAKASLVEADLSDSDGAGAVFRRTNLTRARFDGGAFGGASFQRAVCLSASFRQADLRGADLTGALLAGADLTGARLAGANLTGAQLDRDTRLGPDGDPDQILVDNVFLDDDLIEGPAVGNVLRSLGMQAGR